MKNLFLVCSVLALASCSKEEIMHDVVVDDVECNCGRNVGYYYSCSLNWLVAENECTANRDTFYVEIEERVPLFGTFCSDTQW